MPLRFCRFPLDRSLLQFFDQLPLIFDDSVPKFLTINSRKIDLIFTDLNTSQKKLEINKQANKPLCAIIGPEGDFSENEREQILNFEGVRPIKINENILRSETAAISAISIINYLIDL